MQMWLLTDVLGLQSRPMVFSHATHLPSVLLWSFLSLSTRFRADCGFNNRQGTSLETSL